MCKSYFSSSYHEHVFLRLLKILLNTLKDLGLEIKSAVAVIEKGDGKKFVEEQTGIEVLSIVTLDVIDGKVVIQKTIED